MKKTAWLGQGGNAGAAPSLMRRAALCETAAASLKGPGNSVAHSSRVPRGSCQPQLDGEDAAQHHPQPLGSLCSLLCLPRSQGALWLLGAARLPAA